MKICFLGCGNIAQAIIDGLIKSGMQPSNIACIERNEQRVKSLKSQNLQIIELENLASIDFDLIVLAVKPKDALSAEQSILKHAPTAIILSVVAGIGIEKYSQPKSIIRVMPNTACAFGKGVTAIYALDQSSVGIQLCKQSIEKSWTCLTLQNEDEMHRFTSIIGSGPSFSISSA
jgi:pyrroline-5-carboxylate reductase